MKEIYHYVASEEDIPFISETYNEKFDFARRRIKRSWQSVYQTKGGRG